MKAVYFTAEPLFEPDLRFWSSVRQRLESKGIRFVATRSSNHDRNPTLALLPDPRSIGEFAQMAQEVPAFSESLRGKFQEVSDLWGQDDWDTKRYEELWYGYLFHILVCKPALILIWNRHRSGGCVLNHLCDELKIPTRIVERTPWPQLISFDARGSLLETDAYRSLREKSSELIAQEESRTPRAEAYTNHVLKKNSWWEQPETRGVERVRDELGIAAGKRVVLFAGQVDQDVQNFHYNPFYSSNLEAFAGFLAALDDPDVFVLGKHHPKSRIGVAAYQEMLDGRGIWTDQVSLEDCMLLVDHVVAVNSAVLFEASLQGKSVLALGETMLSGCGVFHEWASAGDGEVTVAWMNEEPRQRTIRQKRHMMLLEHILGESVFYYGEDASEVGLSGSNHLAETIAELVATSESGKAPEGASSLFAEVDPFQFFWGLEDRLAVIRGREYLAGRRFFHIKDKIAARLPKWIRSWLGAVGYKLVRGRGR